MTHQFVFHLTRHGICLIYRGIAYQCYIEFSDQLMPEPPRANVRHIMDVVDVRSGMPDIVYYLRIDAIEQARKNRFAGLPDNSEDRGRNQQADDWVGQRKAQPYPGRANDHRKARKPIGTGVIAVGDQGGAIHLATDSDPKNGH